MGETSREEAEEVLYGGVDLIGSITLNKTVGGINPYSIS
jgi:hypothetical protein